MVNLVEAEGVVGEPREGDVLDVAEEILPRQRLTGPAPAQKALGASFTWLPPTLHLP